LYPLFSFISTLLISALILATNITGMEILAKTVLYVQFISLIISIWLPVANPVISIWINRPYRDAVRKFLVCFKQNPVNVTKVQPFSQHQIV
jgi:hypothetical protein